MAEAVALAKLGDLAAVDWALGHAAVLGRFPDGDLAAILAQAGPGSPTRPTACRTAPVAGRGFGR